MQPEHAMKYIIKWIRDGARTDLPNFGYDLYIPNIIRAYLASIRIRDNQPEGYLVGEGDDSDIIPFPSLLPAAPPSPPYSSAHIGLTMLRMRLPVLRVLRGECGIPNDQEVLGVLFLGRLGEIEAASEDGFAIDSGSCYAQPHGWRRSSLAPPDSPGSRPRNISHCADSYRGSPGPVRHVCARQAVLISM